MTEKDLRDHFTRGGDAFWLGNQVVQIYGKGTGEGTLLVRLRSQINSIEVDADEILLSGKGKNTEARKDNFSDLLSHQDEKHDGYLKSAIAEAMSDPNGIYARELRNPGNLERNVRKFTDLKLIFSNPGTVMEKQKIIISQKDLYTEFRMMSAIQEFAMEYRKLVTINKQDMSQTEKKDSVEILAEQAKYLGFGENLTDAIARGIGSGQKEFTVPVQIFYKVPGQDSNGNANEKSVDYELKFSRSTNPDYENYFLNGYKATISENPEKSRFFGGPSSKGLSFTAKESFNLLEGRSVEKTVKEGKNKDGEKIEYPDGKTDWYKLDYTAERKDGQIKLESFGEKYLNANGKIFDLKEILGREGVSEMGDPQKSEQIIASLKKGNTPLATIREGEKERKVFLAADPQFKKIVKFSLDGKKEFEKKKGNEKESGKGTALA